ncbi:MAG: hypothetical protein Q9207_004364 [Kuettlingeria erythrocarpa]
MSSPYGVPMHFTPRQKHKYRRYGRAAWLNAKRISTTRTTWFLCVIFLTLLWWINGGSKDFDGVKLGAAGLGRGILHNGVLENMQVKNTTSLLLSLRNSPADPTTSVATSAPGSVATVSNGGHMSFRPNSASNKPATPVSLLARIDQEEYILMPNASALVAICSGSLQRTAKYDIRIIAPMTDDYGKGIVQLEGIWLDKGAQFERIEGTVFNDISSDEGFLSEQNDEVGEQHRAGLSRLLKGRIHDRPGNVQEVLKEDDGIQDFRDRRKLLEVITDAPGSSGRRTVSTRTGGADGLLAGVMGWEYLLGEMFGSDHTSIGVDGMCLVQDCVGGVGRPNGIGDVFFRSGPPGSALIEHPWLFNGHVPDVLVIDLGNSDNVSFDLHATDYNTTAWDLAERFEDTYVSLVKAIRSLAYPKHPATIHSERSAYKMYVPNSVPASIPIFVMRPLRGELEHATQNIVNRLRADGDKAVFWLDTSGWLDATPSEHNSITEDFYLDDRTEPPRWRLSERGNQRVAIFLHMHVCRYLAKDGEKCPFLLAEVYEGKVFDPSERDFERYVEGEKERRLRKLFWYGQVNPVDGNTPVTTTTG